MRYRYAIALIVAVALTFFIIALGNATHNAAGGYRDACGERAGLLGDDC